jgi:hypothetical protein
MLASLKATTPVEDWFDSQDNIRAAVRYVQGKVFLVSSESRPKVRDMNNLLEEYELELLQCLVRQSPWAKAPQSITTDFTLGKCEPAATTLTQIESRNLLEKLANKRLPAAGVSENFENAFERKIGVYLPFCREVTLSDPHAGFDIVRSGDKPPKFLLNLLDSHKFHFSLHTSVPSRQPQTKSEGEKIAGVFERMVSQKTMFQGTYSIYVYKSDTRRFHNRKLGLGFNNGGIGFTLENSVGNLSRERFMEVSDISTTDFNNFRMHLNGVRQGIPLLHEETFE